MQNKKIPPAFDDLDNPETIINHIEKLVGTNDLSTLIESLKINPKDEILPPEKAWEQVINEDKTAILGTLGNFSLIIGKAKSRKSFFISIAVSTVVSDVLMFNRFKGCLPVNQSNVLYFDTEQGKYHVQLALKRICKQTGIDEPKNLSVYGLRSLNPSKRLEAIEHIIYNTENLGFVVIDGIKDLINSINDEQEATMIASKLLKWTEEKNIHIVTVLHQNKSDNNARGHIGSELINKAETVLSITKDEFDKDISIVEAQQCRNIEPEPFAFEIIDNLPVIAENFEIRTEKKNNKFDILEIEGYKKFELLTDVFSKASNYSYSELVIQLKLAFKNKFSKKIGDNRIKELITDCKNNNWLLQDKPKTPYKIGKYNQTDEDAFD